MVRALSMLEPRGFIPASGKMGGMREREGDINMRVPLLMLVVKGVFASDTGLAFTLSSVVPHSCVPIVLHSVTALLLQRPISTLPQ